MKILLAQIKSLPGDVEQNTVHHVRVINEAVVAGADLVVFPELSLTGYEPALADQVAFEPEDHRFREFQMLSNSFRIVIGIGVPVRCEMGITISLIIFQPQRELTIYAKQYLHPDEEAYFVGKSSPNGILINNSKVALAICYELSVPAHTQVALGSGAAIYLASAAKSASGVAAAAQQLSTIAKNYQVPVLLVNNIGPADNFVGAGQSAVWDENGELLAELGEEQEGGLLYHTKSKAVSKIVFGVQP